MFDHLFIAEKPSLAEEVARARAKQVGTTASKGSGYWTVGGDAVTWLFGHMYEQAPPQHYDARYKNWSIADLPIIPSKWRIFPVEKQAGRVRELHGLIKNAKIVVNVGDAAREGQLLVDELVVESGRDPFGPDVLRLWLQDLTEQKKIEALGRMFPNADKRDLYNAALGRQRADWLLGMNMTRLYTGLAQRSGMQKGVISVGRVQTPTLRLVVDRDREIEKFKAVDHYLPSGLFRHANGAFKASWIIPADHEGLDHEGRLVDKSVAERISAKIAGKTGRVDSFEVKKKSKSPPLPFDLSGLQKELSAKFGFTAQKTLDIAQSLYETHKVTSYPRTESPYLPTGIFNDDAAGIVDRLKGVPEYQSIADGANLKLKSPAWNDSKVTDHYAIIPTTEATPAKIAALPEIERKVFDLIAKRFMAQFYPDYRWDSLTAMVTVEGERFKATGNNPTDKGWKAVYERGQEKLEKDEDEDEDDQALPVMSRGDSVTVEKSGLDSKRTTPPARFTDGTLIEAMKTIHKFVPDSAAKKRLKESSGIGTGATRANILETLVYRSFLVRKGKFIQSSPLGRDVIDVLDQQLTDPALTAIWEEQLERVQNGELGLDAFIGSLAQEVKRLVDTLQGTTVKLTGATKPLPGTGEICPSCGVGHLVTRTVVKGPNKDKQFIACDRYAKDDPAACKYAKWPDEPIKPLEGHGELCPQCKTGHLVTRAVMKPGPNKGKRFLACDAYSKDVEGSCTYTAWEKPKPIEGSGVPCPQCGKGHLVTRVVTKDGPHKGKSFLSCDQNDRNNPASCNYMAWPKEEVKPLPGHGDTCPQCKTGKMVTRQINKDGPNKGKRFLSCDNYRKGDSTSCNHAIWPDEGPRKADGTGVPKGGLASTLSRPSSSKRFAGKAR